MKEVSVIDASSSAWRTAYISTLFEKDAVKLAVGILKARSAINERLNSPVEIGATERQALEVARQALRSLKAQRVDAIVGETLGP